MLTPTDNRLYASRPAPAAARAYVRAVAARYRVLTAAAARTASPRRARAYRKTLAYLARAARAAAAARRADRALTQLTGVA